jgi:hypothetical protein
LLYVEYALELSNVDIYFKPEEGNRFEIDSRMLIGAAFVIGLIVGISAMALFRKPSRKNR